MNDRTTHRLLWLLTWAVMIVVYLVGNYTLKLERDNARLHAEVEASMIPPEVKIFRGPLTAERHRAESRQGATETLSKP